jgi:hypothetical protein
MWDVWTALHTGNLPQVGPLASIGTFHHGPLTYDLWLVPGWIGGGDPTFVVAETALLGILVVAIVWWVARGIGGPWAGLAAAYVAAVSAALIYLSTFVWNPTLLEPGAAVALLGMWEAWRSRDPRWWAVTAAGLAVAMQAHVSGPILAMPTVGAYLIALWRRPSGTRRRQLAWGAVAVAGIAATYLPYLEFELGHGFSETRAMLTYLTSPDSSQRLAAPLAVLVAFVRILAWPLTDWPLMSPTTAFPVATAAATAVASGLALGILEVRRQLRSAITGEPDATVATTSRLRDRRDGLMLVAGSLATVIVVGGLGLKDISLVQKLPTEQYHAWADPLAIVAAGLVLGRLWRAGSAWHGFRPGQAATVATLCALTVWNAANWPPITSPDGGYPAAQAAARQIEADAAGTAIALVSLYPLEGTQGYGYPLLLDGVRTTSTAEAATIVLLCDEYFVEGCGGPAEAAWVAANEPDASMELLRRMTIGTQQVLSVYRRTG